MPLVDLKLTTVIVTALVDSINPCAIGVLILLISTLIVLAENKKRMIGTGLLYIATVYITYFLAGIGLLLFIQRFNISEPLGVIVGFLVILLGLMEIKDFFWYGKGFSLGIPQSQIPRMRKWAEKGSIPAVIGLGFLVAAVELPCTGGPYLAITTLLAKDFSLYAIWLLLLYNFLFVLPLIIIVALAYAGLSIEEVHKWKESKKRWMRLLVGLVMVALGVLLILYANGTISL